MKKILVTMMLFAAALLTASAGTLLEQADSAYNKEDFRQALRLYTQAMNEDGVSPELYYNLGNTYYRINNLGRAVLCYRRALNLDASMDDARANLEFVKTKILDKPEDDSSFLGNLHESITAWMSPDAWAWVAFSLFATLIACLSLYIFSGNVLARKTGFFGGMAVLVLWIYASVIAYGASRAYYHSDYAVVTVPTSNMRTVPGNSSSDENKILPIHEGTLLEITDSITLPGETASPKWYDVRINNTTRAWVNAADIEKL